MGFIVISVNGPAGALGVIITREGYRVPRFSFGGVDYILN